TNQSQSGARVFMESLQARTKTAQRAGSNQKGLTRLVPKSLAEGACVLCEFRVAPVDPSGQTGHRRIDETSPPFERRATPLSTTLLCPIYPKPKQCARAISGFAWRSARLRRGFSAA